MNATNKSDTNAARRRVLLVDDHPLMREGVANWINRSADLEVCGEAETAEDALQLAGKLRPDIVVADISLQGKSGFELIKDLHPVHPRLPVLILSMHEEAFYADRAIRAGAAGYIMKDAGGAKLVDAIRQVLRGEIYVGPAVAAKLLARISRLRPRGSHSPVEELSDREFEVFTLIGQGADPESISRKLHVSRKTVDVHRANIKRKLALDSSAALVYHAVRWLESRQAELSSDSDAPLPPLRKVRTDGGDGPPGAA